MKYPNVFDLIAVEFGKAKIDFVLIGGFAVNSYKVSRQTADVDFLITDDDYARALKILKTAGYEEEIRQKIFARLRSSTPGFMDVDFMFIDEPTLKTLITEGKKIKIAGQKFIAPSLEHLIALKLHSIKHNPKLRETKDLADIINLVRINKVNPKSKDFRGLCMKFGNPELYEKILQAF